MHLHSVRIIAGALCAAALVFGGGPSFGQSAEPKGGGQRQSGTDGDAQKKLVEEIAEAARTLRGPAGNPECVWLGRNVVGLLWQNDLDTAFRHLDIYDRFGCPSGHIQATFRCLVRHGKPDLKPPENWQQRVHTCWINPSTEPAAPTPSAAAPSGTTSR